MSAGGGVSPCHIVGCIRGRSLGALVLIALACGEDATTPAEPVTPETRHHRGGDHSHRTSLSAQ